MHCKYIKANNVQCKGNAMDNSEYCYIHNPKISSKAKHKSRSKGGKSKIIKMTKPIEKPFEFNSASDIKTLLSFLINKVLAGELDLRIATGVTYISSCLLKVYIATDLETRITLLEKGPQNYA